MIRLPRPQRMPTSIPEFLAYQLARVLDDSDNRSRYLILSQRFTIPFLLQAYRQAKAASERVDDRRRIFWQIIERSSRYD